ncbi:LAMI_0A02036g1_1 [Lachancea mirantina]|uniref:E3 ubiquitin protein ligase n=1 Tax=Lachancea mirantina TaxID=1230905 RepID=A0A1G4IM56_9SACH|nr:LAMI_0A02036g1_1 [Lachancea mirantina]
MHDEPRSKKPKLELSDASEPLTRSDVIAFQKEALFRSLNQHRTREACLVQQQYVWRAQEESLRARVASACAVLVSLAEAARRVCADDRDAGELCARVAQWGADADDAHAPATQEQARAFAALVERHLAAQAAASAAAEAGDDHCGKLHELEALKIRLQTQNRDLRQELDTVQSFYQERLRKYDRFESETVKRVFKNAEQQGPENEADATKSAAPSATQEASNGSGDSSGEQPKSETNGDTVPKLEHELHLQELNSQIEILRNTIASLEAWKKNSEQQLKETRAELALQPTADALQHGSDAQTGHLLQKLEHLTAENRQLSDLNDSYLAKFQQLVKEKEIFTNKLSTEFQTAQDALKKHNATLEKDLVRIRAARDELVGKLAIMEREKSKCELLDNLKRLLDLQSEQIDKMGHGGEERPQDALRKELQDLEKAFREQTTLVNKKFSEYANYESALSKLNVEKTKADQKYFAAMRSKDSILIENKNLSKNLSKSTELIIQLKDVERTLQMKIENLNKQLEVLQSNEKRLVDASKVASVKIMDLTSEISKARRVTESLRQDKTQLVQNITHLESEVHSLQTDRDTLQMSLSNSERRAKKLHQSLFNSGGDTSLIAEELENFRTIVYCSLCSKNWKDTAIKTCGHVFCAECCKERLAARMRKCPTCNKGFSANDLLVVHL